MIRTGKMCVSFLFKYMTSVSDNDDDPLKAKSNKLRCLSDVFSNYGGVFSKISQLLCYNDSSNKVYSECKPFSKNKTIQYLKELCDSTLKDVKNIDFNVYKSGSIGQVHKAINENDDPIIIKVQYIGLYEQTEQDLNMLDTVTSYLYKHTDMKDAINDIKKMMYEELDYKKEYSNHRHMYNIWKDSEIIQIPELIPSLCTDKIISMKYVEGICLHEFIQKFSQEEKNIVGKHIVKFIFENIYVHGVFYSDIHYGNFLVKPDMKLCVLDFGCLHFIDKLLLENIKSLHIALQTENKDLFFLVMEKMNIIRPTISDKSKQYAYNFFQLINKPWLSSDFEFTDEWLSEATHKDLDLMKEWNLPADLVYFNKIAYGAIHILTKLKLRSNLKEIFNNIITF